MELESQGYFAVRSLTTDPRWGNGSIYLFGVDAYGISLFNGDPFSPVVRRIRARSLHQHIA